MKKKITITVSIAIAVALFLVFQGGQKFAMSYDGAAPSGYAGDPAGGSKNCSQCHGGSATTVSGIITSNIPGTGYVPGTSYQVTVTLTGTGGNKGFSISPQNSTGVFLGTLISGTGTSLNGTNHYVRSSGSGITTNPMTWNFNWIAPATGLGPVTFFGAFSIGTGTTLTTTYPVSESTIGLTEAADNNSFAVFPNPVADNLNISYTLNSNSKVVINVYSVDGKRVACILNSEQASGNYAERISIKNLFSKGAYIIELKIDKTSAFKKILVG
ncbi:MAG: choice-of-anchor V domain-containing protein [Bacteroidota bacterium]